METSASKSLVMLDSIDYGDSRALVLYSPSKRGMTVRESYFKSLKDTLD